MTEDEKQEILQGYKWIKLRRYEMDESLSWEERYKQLEAHHEKETTFLIEKIREIVRNIQP